MLGVNKLKLKPFRYAIISYYNNVHNGWMNTRKPVVDNIEGGYVDLFICLKLRLVSDLPAGVKVFPKVETIFRVN